MATKANLLIIPLNDLLSNFVVRTYGTFLLVMKSISVVTAKFELFSPQDLVFKRKLE